MRLSAQQKRQKKKPREIIFSKAGTTWRFGGISNRYTSQQIYGRNILSTTSEQFTRRSQSDAGNRNRPIHGSVTMHTGGSVLFAAHAK